MSSSSTSFFLNDGRGSVVQTTNTQGSTTSWKSYSAFGEVEVSSNLGELPTYGYNAEEQHPQTGLTYLRFRYYEAKTSTFGVQDTYLGNIFSPLTLNRYLYCLANPVNYVDPSGHMSVQPFLNSKFVAMNAVSKLSIVIHKAVVNLFLKIGDSASAVKFARKLRKAQNTREKFLKFYCGNAERIAAGKQGEAKFYAMLEKFENDYWYVPILSDIAAVGVSSHNSDIPGTLFNLGMLMAGGTPAKAVKAPSKLAPVVAKLFKGADKTGDAVGASEKLSSKLIFGSEVKSSAKLERQMADRGWTEQSIKDLVDNPYTTRVSKNKGNNSAPATAYYTKEGDYVVVDDTTFEVVQVSKKGDPDWIPDPSIENPYRPESEN